MKPSNPAQIALILMSLPRSALKELGYDKYVSFECGTNGDRNVTLPAAVELLRAQWKLA